MSPGLIAASFGTVVYNAYYCSPMTVLFYSLTNFSCGVLGSYLPFQQWFNERKNKVSRHPFAATPRHIPSLEGSRAKGEMG
jgi:adiponectin receptor